MKEVPKLWLLDNGNKKFWFYLGPPDCEACDNKVMSGFYFANWNENDFRHGFVCEKCTEEWQKMNLGSQEYKPVLVCDEVPPSSLPVNVTHHGWSHGRYTDTFSAALKSSDGETIMDKTKLSGRPEATIEGAIIGRNPEEISYQPPERDFDALMEFHKQAPPALEEDEKKELEGDTK